VLCHVQEIVLVEGVLRDDTPQNNAHTHTLSYTHLYMCTHTPTYRLRTFARTYAYICTCTLTVCGAEDIRLQACRACVCMHLSYDHRSAPSPTFLSQWASSTVVLHMQLVQDSSAWPHPAYDLTYVITTWARTQHSTGRHAEHLWPYAPESRAQVSGISWWVVSHQVARSRA
jgi:hypothetical protein